MFERAPNVVVEDAFRSLIRRGYRAEVVCEESAVRKNHTWCGVWFVRVISDETGEEFILVTERGKNAIGPKLQPRLFKTMLGLCSLLYDAGHRFCDIPFNAGTRALQRKVPPASDDSAD
ncbi:hypothetical protein U0C82_17500 [Fulvimarina sp. 2208YS6-2-32]|uniref:Transposase n=1 Tax=Fulvimarina uroteuthidis TaxID=3098149 RepID=A0ABU5I761_9HYPH|nr:hypothetical protein [Fulvimarina sp. 2208YS6-2-32]MDY8110937.1 hypothetical protein [Fulvimarina sp. 2208YS6-2-32]